MESAVAEEKYFGAAKFTNAKIEIAVDRTDNKKAPGSDGILNDSLPLE